MALKDLLRCSRIVGELAVLSVRHPCLMSLVNATALTLLAVPSVYAFFESTDVQERAGEPCQERCSFGASPICRKLLMCVS